MPAKSKAQQKAAGAAMGAKRGETKIRAEGRLVQMYESMSEQQLDDFAETERKDLPEHVSESKGD